MNLKIVEKVLEEIQKQIQKFKKVGYEYSFLCLSIKLLMNGKVGEEVYMNLHRYYSNNNQLTKKLKIMKQYSIVLLVFIDVIWLIVL